MRKEKDNRELNIDLLLRNVAEKENEALPLEDWKRQLFKKIESDQPQRGESSAMEEESPIADELASRRRRNMRRLTIGFSTVAAALLIVLGTSQYWQDDLKAKSAPQEEIRMAAEAAPYDAAPSEAGLPEALYAAPEAPALEAPAAEAPASEAPAADKANTDAAVPAPAAPAPSVPTDNAAGSTQAGILSGPVELTPEQEKAVDALNAALPTERGKVDSATAIVVQLELVTLKVRPLSGGETQEVTRTRVYKIMVGMDTGAAISYAVDAETYEVLGEIVEG